MNMQQATSESTMVNYVTPGGEESMVTSDVPWLIQWLFCQ